jgi:hypothetical protein
MPKWNAFDNRDQKKNPPAAGIPTYLIDGDEAAPKRIKLDAWRLASWV